MCTEKSLMSQVLLNTCTLVKVLLGTKTWGRLRPPKFLFGGGGGRYSAAYEHKGCELSLIFLLSHCRLRTRVRGKWRSRDE